MACSEIHYKIHAVREKHREKWTAYSEIHYKIHAVRDKHREKRPACSEIHLLYSPQTKSSRAYREQLLSASIS